MNRTAPLAAAALLTLIFTAPHLLAQGAPTKAAEAVRQQKLKAAQAAALANARANATANPPVATINRPAPTSTPIVTAPPPPAATAAPKPAAATSASAAPATSTKPALSAAPAASGSAVPISAATHPDTASIALDLDALKKTRPDRRHAEFLDLQARFGSLLGDSRATAELKQHGQRIAYLQRIRALGVKANDANFVKSVDALITTEETRDANALNALRTSALPAPVPVAATAVAAPIATAVTTGGAK